MKMFFVGSGLVEMTNDFLNRRTVRLPKRRFQIGGFTLASGKSQSGFVGVIRAQTLRVVHGCDVHVAGPSAGSGIGAMV